MTRAFDGDFTDDDWGHSVGGWHVVAIDAKAIVAHASVVGRELDVGDVRFDTGYVEAAATEPGRQGLGFGTTVMRAVAELIEAHHQLGALSTGEHHFYERLGWERWQGPAFVRNGDELIRTPDEDDGIMVMRFGSSSVIDLSASITCEARAGDDW
jgi:aminoglycoside 2'-N-acetyltransferase I